uniref:Uncharacterized protein n=1 Tax=Acrobeloides nanus TaxID=290746 RepID=A0A914DIN6_9BILA
RKKFKILDNQIKILVTKFDTKTTLFDQEIIDHLSSITYVLMKKMFDNWDEFTTKEANETSGNILQLGEDTDDDDEEGELSGIEEDE